MSGQESVQGAAPSNAARRLTMGRGSSPVPDYSSPSHSGADRRTVAAGELSQPHNSEM